MLYIKWQRTCHSVNASSLATKLPVTLCVQQPGHHLLLRSSVLPSSLATHLLVDLLCVQQLGQLV